MKKTISSAAAGMALLALAASCSATQNMNISELSGRWEITAVEGKAVEMTVPDAEIPYLGFDTATGRLTGNAGCNSIKGAFVAGNGDGKITFDKIASTRMMCPDMNVEQSVLQALDKVTGYKKTGAGNVVLTGDNGTPLVSLRKVEDGAVSGSLEGTWLIKTLDGKDLVPTPEASYTVKFDAGNHTFSCATGCNILGGAFSADKSKFKFDLSTSTMMMCPDMSVEDTLKRILPTVTGYGPVDGGIGFYSGTDRPVMVIVR